MSLKTKLYTEPKISPESHDMSIQWYVWFRFFDASTNKYKQLRFFKDINTFKKLKDRTAAANALKQFLKSELETGWNPLIPEVQDVININSLVGAIDHILKVKNTTLSKKSQYAYRYIMLLFTEWLKD